ncbi:RNA-guided endonuclease InsQ/TnpB family protein [Gloeothece verrucosa]|uniref:Transposase, IS605 OrfB family n=1 Tax=Gloeothece verrucosa (strain PCC 7822) TaxID=497965 RepID=E0U6W2_GLOV7|nr:RNA-guided endonuclease TnpB family protein [Gloeothece verrucosa]ADN14891.1 transposase, IS605 OrfB family [Gloeothece verrucosa PCC 7822]ADN15999.1 transposase, IS605 OrfB family [Gloeothece verrucosa PCC 7822]
MYGCQQVLINSPPDVMAVLEYVCSEANKLYNCGLYYARQIYFKTHQYIGKYTLDKQLKSNLHFKALRSCVAQQTLRSVYEAFVSYWKLLSMWKRGELPDKPRIPKYRKKGFYQFVYPKQWLKLIGNEIKFSLGKQVKTWFKLDSFSLPMPSNLRFENIKEVRIIPRNRCFYAEFVYQLEIQDQGLNQDNALGIDPGLNNWLTCVSNVGTSFILDGKHLKSVNRWYNKQVSTIKEGKPQGLWSNRLAKITEKRNRQMRDAVNKAARIVVNHCLDNHIGTIVFGWNDEVKKEINLGKKNNQSFVSIPTARLKNRIAQLCELYGIRFIETEESYTSKASFLDGDIIPVHGAKPEGWKSSGKRTKRGLFRTGNNWYINADCNGAANIIRKVATTLNLDLSPVNRGVLTRPQKLKFWSAKKTLRNGVLTRCEASA